jgi:hypothetical protein
MQDLPVDRLGPYPILQLAAAILILGGLAFAIWRASRDRRSIATVIPDEQRWFFDGPLATSINILRDIKNHQDRLVNLNEEVIEAVRHQTGVLHDIKNELEFNNRTRKFGE